MLKVLIAEDEVLIREGLKTQINWNAYGFEVDGVACDGKDALKIMEKVKPDLVITDIRMPFMDGIELIERTKMIYPNAFFVIISGYEDFEYAKKAIQLGVTEYILKPIIPEEIHETLDKVNKCISQNMKNEEDMLNIKKQIHSSKKISKENLLRKFVNRHIEFTSKKEYTDFAQEMCLNKYFCIVITQVDDYLINTCEMDKEQVYSYNKMLFEAISSVLRIDDQIIAFKKSDFEDVICISQNSITDIVQKRTEVVNKIRKKVFDVLSGSLTMAVGGSYQSLEKLVDSYEEALSMLDYKFILGKGKDIYFEEKRLDKQKKADSDQQRYIDGIIQGTIELDKVKTENNIKFFVECIGSAKDLKSTGFRVALSDIYLSLIKNIKESGGKIEEIFESPTDIYEEILMQEVVEDVKKKLIEICFAAIDYLTLRKGKKYSRIVSEAMAYIADNYSDGTITLKGISKHFNIAPCYFSNIFSKETGSTYKDYMTNIRINKAKELMQSTDLLDYEICYNVGYNNPTYFSTIFKRRTGSSPSDYRKSL